MYKLLIVDDEPTVRYGLRHYFDWAEYGIEAAEEADDGDAALEAAERVRPDLVLTDVRMPNMSGIELSRVLREKYPETKIVFVSGHDDADYLKSALQVNAVDYIFKPVNLQELRTVIERVAAELANRDRERLLARDMQEKLRESMPLLRERFLLSTLQGRAALRSGAEERIRFLELQLPLDAEYEVIVLSLDNYAELKDARSERDLQLLVYAATNIAQELIDRCAGGYAFESGVGEIAGLLRWSGEDDPEERLLTLAGDIRDNLERWLKIGATIGVGSRTRGLSKVCDSYAQAREAASRKWYLGKNRIITMDSLSVETAEGREERIDHAQIERLTTLLRAGDAEALRDEMNALFDRLTEHRASGFAYGRNVSLQIALLADQLLLEFGIGQAAGAPRVWESLTKKETIEDLRMALEQYISSVCAAIRERRDNRSSNLVERVQAVLAARYAENLSVADVGKEVYLSPTYVSLLYKQETGRTINEALTAVRIEKAKELLRDPKYKFYDVCFAVGYADPSYFTKLFKKMTGLTPKAYRDQLY
ncbi:response regulator [Paenibacillus antri]|uniref:Response regulator n=1 Tax=Paenibacillus antri TaxID=2582848 RepID=A0A5R9G9X7_9BACL|nr:response regulator [Paenibacillus antri]TLS51909.1 response regulator [Paenibacillus antri]